METSQGTKKYLGGSLLFFPISALLLCSSVLSSDAFLPPSSQGSKTPFNVNLIRPQKLKNWLEQGRPLLLVDARRPQQYASGHIPTAVSVHTYRSSQKSEQARDGQVPVVFYCNGPGWSQYHLCARAIAQEFRDGSNQVYWFVQGMRAWRAHAYPVVKSSEFER